MRVLYIDTLQLSTCIVFEGNKVNLNYCAITRLFVRNTGGVRETSREGVSFWIYIHIELQWLHWVVDIDYVLLFFFRYHIPNSFDVNHYIHPWCNDPVIWIYCNDFLLLVLSEFYRLAWSYRGGDIQPDHEQKSKMLWALPNHSTVIIERLCIEIERDQCNSSCVNIHEVAGFTGCYLQSVSASKKNRYNHPIDGKLAERINSDPCFFLSHSK